MNRYANMMEELPVPADQGERLKQRVLAAGGAERKAAPYRPWSLARKALLAAVAFGAGLYLAALLPHGIFELAALVLAAACGVYLCRNIGRLVTNSPKKIPAVELLTDLLRVLVMVIAPLTAAAAFIESYITPVIASLFM